MSETFKEWSERMAKTVTEKSFWSKDEVEENLKRIEKNKKEKK